MLVVKYGCLRREEGGTGGGKESSSLPGILTVARGMAAMATACFLHNTTSGIHQY